MLRRQSRPLPTAHPAAAPHHRAARVGLLRPHGPSVPAVEPPAADHGAGAPTRLEACIEHHLERVRMRTHGRAVRPGVVDDASARCDPPTRPFSLAGLAPAPRRATSSVSRRSSPRATAQMPAVAG